MVDAKELQDKLGKLVAGYQLGITIYTVEYMRAEVMATGKSQMLSVTIPCKDLETAFEIYKLVQEACPDAMVNMFRREVLGPKLAPLQTPDAAPND